MNFDKFDEVVAAKIDGIITNDRKTIIEAIENNKIEQFISRLEFEIMSALDFGSKWTEFSKAPTLFIKPKALDIG